MKPTLLAAAAVWLALAGGLDAQERVANTGAEPSYRAGWTLTPSFGVNETYDDNISLFAVNTAEGANNDFVTSYFPSADLHYAGRHTSFGAGYTGSFLAYRTFTTLNRWDQRGRFDFKRQESAHLQWSLRANAAAVPTTDSIDLGGIPFRRTGARTKDGRAMVEYVIGARDAVTGSFGFQTVDFDRADLPGRFLEGGRAIDGSAAWRHRLTSRFGAGADYSQRVAQATGDTTSFRLHSYQAAVDYELSPAWSLSAAGGLIYLQENALTQSRTGPAWRVGVSRRRTTVTLQSWYLRSYVPSFAFGGTIQSQELGFGLRAPLFHSRYFYTEQSAMYRNDQPLTNTVLQLPLRSFRTNSIFGWAPQPWVHIQAFYSRTDQTSMRVGAELHRNRIGFQIVTSKPVRIQ